jgi:hypothetical protein
MRQLIAIGVGGFFCVSTALADELSVFSGDIGASSPKLLIQINEHGLGEKNGNIPQLIISDQGINGGHAVGNRTVGLSNKNGGAGSLTPKMTMGSGGHYAQVAQPVTWPSLTISEVVDACFNGSGTPADHNYHVTYHLDLSTISYVSTQSTVWLGVQLAGTPASGPNCVVAQPPADAPQQGQCRVFALYACIA